jgi:2-polyprenyl-3-methyl-5-hydroxy-6-metoxy-1,4-benzoquinol methylase
LNAEQIQQRRQEICRRYGDWTAHNISLRDGLYTYDESHPKFHAQLVGHGTHLRRIVQIIADMTNQPLRSLRVLDLGCLEGLYAIELARHGAEVVAIEGRQANIEKARFAQEVLGLDNLTLLQEDVRNLCLDRHGSFDVVLCLGVLYHLDAPDVFHFVEKLSEVCRRLAILDTHVTTRGDYSCPHQGREYRGWYFTEHTAESTPEQRLRNLWASLDNEKSFWFTRPSLFNLLSASGFTSVSTSQNPAVPGQMADRDTLIAVKGKRVELLCTPLINSAPEERWPEQGETDVPAAEPEVASPARSRPMSFKRLRQGLLRRLLNHTPAKGM